jgi:hypothetical protein
MNIQIIFLKIKIKFKNAIKEFYFGVAIKE